MRGVKAWTPPCRCKSIVLHLWSPHSILSGFLIYLGGFSFMCFNTLVLIEVLALCFLAFSVIKRINNVMQRNEQLCTEGVEKN